MTTIKPLRRRVAAVSAPVLLALSLTACGGGSDAAGAPDDASVDDFCAAQTDVPDNVDENDNAAILDAAKDNAKALADVGTPTDFSADARAGFEAYIDFIDGAEESDVESNDDLEATFGDDADKVTAYFTEAATACTPDTGDLGGDLEGQPDDLQSELPTDLPTDLPS